MLDARNGSVEWLVRFPRRTPSAPVGAAGRPVIVGDVVVAAAGDGSVYGLDRVSGRVWWTLGARIGGPEGDSACRPVNYPSEPGGRPDDDALGDFRAIAYRHPTLFITSLSGVLCAVHPATRRQKWRFSSPSDGSILFDLTAAGAVVYVPYASGRLIAVDASSGRERWRMGGRDQRFEWPPAVRDGKAYVTSEDGLYAISETRH